MCTVHNRLDRLRACGIDFNDESIRNMSSNSLALEKAHSTVSSIQSSSNWFYKWKKLFFWSKFIPNYYAIYCIQCYFNLIQIWFKFDAIKQRNALNSIWIYVLCISATVRWLAHWLKNIIHWITIRWYPGRAIVSQIY